MGYKVGDIIECKDFDDLCKTALILAKHGIETDFVRDQKTKLEVTSVPKERK